MAEATPDGVWRLPLIRAFASSRFRIVLASLATAFGLFAHALDRSLVAPKLHGVAPDFGAYYAAAERTLAGVSPYLPTQLSEPVDAVCSGCYLYPPFLAQILAPLTVLPPATASVLWWVSQVMMALTAVWLATGLGGARRSLERFLWCLVAVLWFAPLYDALRLGNVTATVALGATLVACGGAATGAGAAIATLIKVVPATLVPAAVFAGRAALLTFVGTAATILAISTVLAPQAWLDYGRVLPNMLAGSVDYSWNFAPANMVSQAAFGEHVRVAVRLGALTLAVAAVFVSVFLVRRRGGAPAAAFLGVLAMLLLPGTLWFHYYGALLPFAAIVWPTARRLVRVGLVASATAMTPYLFEPLPGVIGALVMVVIIGWSLARAARGLDTRSTSLARTVAVRA